MHSYDRDEVSFNLTSDDEPDPRPIRAPFNPVPIDEEPGEDEGFLADLERENEMLESVLMSMHKSGESKHAESLRPASKLKSPSLFPRQSTASVSPVRQANRSPL